MATDFRALLSQNSTQVSRPKPLPEGNYYGKITKQEFGKSRNKQTPFIRFFIVPSHAADDIPEEDLVGIDLASKELRKDFYITDDATYRLSNMLDAVIGDPDRSFEERIPETRGVLVLFHVTQRKSDNGEDVFNDVGTIVAADEEE